MLTGTTAHSRTLKPTPCKSQVTGTEFSVTGERAFLLVFTLKISVAVPQWWRAVVLHLAKQSSMTIYLIVIGFPSWQTARQTRFLASMSVVSTTNERQVSREDRTMLRYASLIIHNSYSTTLAHRDVIPNVLRSSALRRGWKQMFTDNAENNPCETPLDIYMRGKRSQQKTFCAVWVCSRKSPVYCNDTL